MAEWERKNQIKVYEFGGFTPEMVWDFGKPIPGLIINDKFIQPKDSVFGVLVSQDNLVQFKRQFKEDQLELVDRFDMNPQGPGQRTHRPRLWRDFFIVRTVNKKSQK